MKLFGTDGVRGLANNGTLAPDVIMKIAQAAASIFVDADRRHTVIIGKDTRLSGYAIESALMSGFISMGVNVVSLGPLPTPAVSMLARSMRADLGVMVSASHNPYYDNGLKFFGPDGFKLSEELEREIERRVDDSKNVKLCKSQDLGRANHLKTASGRYVEFVKNTLPRQTSFHGLKIVVDCANGAAYQVAPLVFWELGADVVTISAEPNGININDACGAVHPENLQHRVLSEKADLGIALDGDADRVIVVDEKGEIIDGDQLMACVALGLHNDNRLKGDAVVATIMSNMGLETFLKEKNMKLIRTRVGDRYVCDAMRKHTCNVGGEQSGHIILSDYVRTGDGLIAALHLVARLRQENKPASEIFRCFTPVPQEVRSLRINDSDPLSCDDFKQLIRSCEQDLANQGRLIVRGSGTEPVLRLMVESQDQKKLSSNLDRLESYLRAAQLVS